MYKSLKELFRLIDEMRFNFHILTTSLGVFSKFPFELITLHWVYSFQVSREI